MNIVQINTVYNKGSTGKIVAQIQKRAESKGHNNVVAYRYPEKGDKKASDVYFISNWLDCHIHNRLARYTRLQGCYSYFRTLKFLRFLRKFNPDLLHLHNLHGSYINLKLLFKYIKKHNVSVIWTLHDCWAFTGFCPHFSLINCDKWKTKCEKCPLTAKKFFDNSDKMYQLKKKLFTGIGNMTLVTPSIWLADLVKQSYLNEYTVKVINNGIDLSVFKPIESNFRKINNIDQNTRILLGVSFGWDTRKGLDVFIELYRRLPSDKYKIVLVGTDDSVDKQLPSGIISIHKTHNQSELAEIYSVADLFINPTREDNFPTVNIEALACGTPVLTFKTGGSPEIIDDSCGTVVEQNNVDSLVKEIISITEKNRYTKEACLKRSEKFDMNLKFDEYVKLYEDCAHCTKRTL